MNSLWLLIGAMAAFAVAYRFYSAFLSTKVVFLNDNFPTASHRLKDGVDYHPTKRLVLFGHHFAAIAGPGPLIGPVLAAQWGYLPGYIWIVIGACLAGGVHDFIILVASMRKDGLSLAKIASENISPLSGIVTSIATLFIIIAILASVAIVVVNALSESPWGMFTILVTIPAALLTGLWMYKIRPGRIVEASLIGVTIVLIGVFTGKPFAESPLGKYLLFTKPTLSIMLPIYAFIASILPVWMLMCPRDYLSSYLKIGVMGVLAVGIFILHPSLKMPATTHFIGGGGPTVSGSVWPFVCIVIMCGAISGFHSLVSSGTTPKMINKESDARFIGYGAMIIEGFVSITALIAACALNPGDYFIINTPQDTPSQESAYVKMVETSRSQFNWDLNPVEIKALEIGTQEKLVGRVGGAVTLAVGMAKVFTGIPFFRNLMSYWYHFVIMFEALFILTLLETGTRVARFVFQEALFSFKLKNKTKGKPDWTLNIIVSFITCFLWGYLLYSGNLNTLWRMLGISNQLLASIALAIGTSYILRTSRKKLYALCTFIPFVWTLITTLTASIQSIRSWNNQIAAAPANQAFLLKTVCILASIMLILTIIITLDSLYKWKSLVFKKSIKTDQMLDL